MSNRYIDPQDRKPEHPHQTSQLYDKPMFNEIKIGQGNFDNGGRHGGYDTAGPNSSSPKSMKHIPTNDITQASMMANGGYHEQLN